ncbi:MAG TPA: type III-B CRISPR module RAMP protein Cmr1 [Deltaproteobacteria bacterium]|nr:type III-B CRISPR module RAMP protein Cmr1 [Deltaproteobacteria bacterium]
MNVRIRTLTPLWTGGVDGTMDKIHETGIIGSLRWWYEAIVRGLGGEACDPTGKGKCEYSPKNNRSPEEQLCPACYVFGTTGWKRRFRLEIVEDKTTPIWEPPDRTLNIRPPNRTRGWYLLPGRMGNLSLKFTGDSKVLSLIAGLLLFLEKWGNLGAKPQLGYGVFAIENRDEVIEWAYGNGGDKSGWKWKVLNNNNDNNNNTNKNPPDLKQFGFFKYRFKPTQPGWWTQVPGLSRVSTKIQPIISQYQTVPVSPSLKNEWRFNQWNRKWGDERETFGVIQPGGVRLRSKVAVSWAYKTDGVWEVRGWVCLKSSNWANKVWDILSNKQIWQTILNAHGQIDTYKPTSSKDVLEILEETK